MKGWRKLWPILRIMSASNKLNTVDYLIKNRGWGRKKVLDIGAGWGQSLLSWGKGSAAIEIQPERVALIKKNGFDCYSINVEESWAKIPSGFDAVYSSNLIEHLLSPHLFLMKIHGILKKGGYLALIHPIVPPFPWNFLWQKYFGYVGSLSVEHVNFFTPKTVKLMLERAGFRVIEQINPGIMGKSWLMPWSRLLTNNGADIMTVAQKVPFHYPAKRLKIFNPSWAEQLDNYYAK